MKILGVDLGSWSIKAVEMEARFRRLDILDMHEIRLSRNSQDLQSVYKQAVKELRDRLPTHPEKIVSSIPNAQVALRFLRLPIKKRKQVEQTFRFELEDNVPFKLEDTVIEHMVQSTEEGSVVVAGIAPKRYLKTQLDWLKAIDLDSDWLVFDGMGLINIYLSQTPPEEAVEPPPGPVLLMDIGHSKTNLAFTHQGRLEFFRGIGWGGHTLSQMLSSSLNLSMEEAERVKAEDLDMDPDKSDERETTEALAVAREAFNQFIADVSHSIVSYRNLSKKQLSAILVTGGTSRLKGIAPFLSKYLHHPVDHLSFPHHLYPEMDAEASSAPSFGEALGQASVFQRKVPFLFNFRRQELAKETSITELTKVVREPSVVLLMKFAALLAVILTVYVMLAAPFAKDEAKQRQDMVKKVFTEVFPNVPAKMQKSIISSPEELRKFIKKKQKEIDDKTKMVAKERTPKLLVVKSISDAFPESVKVDVNNVKLDDRSITIEGVLYDGDLNAVTQKLKEMPHFADIRLNQQGKRFTYQGELKP